MVKRAELYESLIDQLQRRNIALSPQNVGERPLERSDHQLTLAMTRMASMHAFTGDTTSERWAAYFWAEQALNKELKAAPNPQDWSYGCPGAGL